MKCKTNNAFRGNKEIFLSQVYNYHGDYKLELGCCNSFVRYSKLFYMLNMNDMYLQIHENFKFVHLFFFLFLHMIHGSHKMLEFSVNSFWSTEVKAGTIPVSKLNFISLKP